MNPTSSPSYVSESSGATDTDALWSSIVLDVGSQGRGWRSRLRASSARVNSTLTMAKRACLEPGCGKLVPVGTARCFKHRRAKDRERGSRQERGYDKHHERLRKAWVPKIRSGRVACARCGHTIRPGQSWDLGHDDNDRSVYTGPEHAACNRATAGRR